jgi:hypothetical protein
LRVTDFRTRAARVVRPPPGGGGGHGGGDFGLAAAFVRAVRAGDQRVLGTDIDDALRAHMLVFAAEHARRENVVVDVAEFERVERKRLGY